MSTEDKEWSLKKKENFIPDAGAHSVDFFDENCYYYNKKDIDALREKLIEDIEKLILPINIGRMLEFDDNDLPYINSDWLEKYLKMIINRRFGIEEK